MVERGKARAGEEEEAHKAAVKALNAAHAKAHARRRAAAEKKGVVYYVCEQERRPVREERESDVRDLAASRETIRVVCIGCVETV